MSKYFDESTQTPRPFPIIRDASAIGLALFVAVLAGCPPYRVWEQKMAGEAELSKAEFSKRVAVQEAQAKTDSSTLLANAEIERAKGVAKANQIIGESLKNNDAYLRYLWVTEVAGNQHATVYVPTEANLPILEAGKRP